ncbi:MAG: FAD-dependent oxidoreductase [Anaerolineaceae bacterium]|nr:MAG: FAD-dependent oxidoreductase [Anaerolineaceae bacterium]
MKDYDVIVIGGGPAGLAAAISADKEGARVLLIEREAKLGGILKQCIHDGFGLVRYGEKLSGPEYAQRFIEEFHIRNIDYSVLTYVIGIEKTEHYTVRVVNTKGVTCYRTKTIILATGCRERTSKQISIHGTRPSGVFTAGTAQAYINILGQMPTKKCVILGSGDIGLIMARRLTLEGAKVCGVYEAKDSPSGLTRNILQCLEDYNIPLYLSHTVTRLFGEDRLKAVEITKVDEKMAPIFGTEEIIECDALILSVGLIPENELAESLHVEIDPRTKGPACDQDFMTNQAGIFTCGNALHVNDLVDYVSESGELAGKAAARYIYKDREYISIDTDNEFLYFLPQKIHIRDIENEMTFYFRSNQVLKNALMTLSVNGKQILKKKYRNLKPPEMETFKLDISQFKLTGDDKVTAALKGENP